MPRAVGQIDVRKNEAILDAASEVMNARGLAAPIETIAKLAGVSKQTIYNHYGSKAALVRALITRRLTRVTRVLEADAQVKDIEAALTELAVELLRPAAGLQTVSLIRIMVLAHDDHEDLANDIYEAGPGAALTATARYLEAAHDAGLIEVDDGRFAAEMFLGMVMGHRQLRPLLRLTPSLRVEDVEQVARETARRFMRAYAPAARAEGLERRSG